MAKHSNIQKYLGNKHCLSMALDGAGLCQIAVLELA